MSLGSVLSHQSSWSVLAHQSSWSVLASQTAGVRPGRRTTAVVATLAVVLAVRSRR